MNLPHNNTWSYLDTGPSDAYTNMAIDEMLLNRMGSEEVLPLLRLYTWSRPAVSVGYFQDVTGDFDLERCTERGWTVVRRLTGGRAVFHDHELTYSILLPGSIPEVGKGVLGSYRYLSQGLLRGLRKLGVNAELVSLHDAKKKRRTSVSKSPDCFASPSWYEISVGGRKIVGSAQKRMPFGILQQGSILISTRRFEEFRELYLKFSDKGDTAAGSSGLTSLEESLGEEVALQQIKKALLQGFQEALGIDFVETKISPDQGHTVRELVDRRYSREEWNLHRKPPVFKEKSRGNAP